MVLAGFLIIHVLMQSLNSLISVTVFGNLATHEIALVRSLIHRFGSRRKSDLSNEKNPPHSETCVSPE